MTDKTLTQDTVLGLFENRQAADSAITKLQEKGYNPKDISIITKDEQGSVDEVNSTGENVAEGATSGALTGGAVGAIAGLLIGVGAIALPGIGGLLIGGPLAAALGLTGAAATTASGALTGALAGGIVGGLVGLGVPQDQAEVYEEHLKQGAILVAVPTSSNGQEMEAEADLAACGATQIHALRA